MINFFEFRSSEQFFLTKKFMMQKLSYQTKISNYRSNMEYLIVDSRKIIDIYVSYECLPNMEER